MQMTEETAWTRVVLADGAVAQPRPDRARQTVHRILAGSLGALMVLLVMGYLKTVDCLQHCETPATRIIVKFPPK